MDCRSVHQPKMAPPPQPASRAAIAAANSASLNTVATSNSASPDAVTVDLDAITVVKLDATVAANLDTVNVASPNAVVAVDAWYGSCPGRKVTWIDAQILRSTE